MRAWSDTNCDSTETQVVEFSERWCTVLIVLRDENAAGCRANHGAGTPSMLCKMVGCCVAFYPCCSQLFFLWSEAPTRIFKPKLSVLRYFRWKQDQVKVSTRPFLPPKTSASPPMFRGLTVQPKLHEFTIFPCVAIENGHKNSGFSHKKRWFSIVMLVYQRVYFLNFSNCSPSISGSVGWFWALPCRDCGSILFSRVPSKRSDDATAIYQGGQGEMEEPTIQRKVVAISSVFCILVYVIIRNIMILWF